MLHSRSPINPSPKVQTPMTADVAPGYVSVMRFMWVNSANWHFFIRYKTTFGTRRIFKLKFCIRQSCFPDLFTYHSYKLYKLVCYIFPILVFTKPLKQIFNLTENSPGGIKFSRKKIILKYQKLILCKENTHISYPHELNLIICGIF